MSNHKNVLKLLGCCLETQVPTLVYEFAASGRLSDHIFEKNLSSSKKNQVLLSWESKVRIAMEIADAVAYLHDGTSKTIIHRDINFDTIYLDQHYVAKLFDFGLSDIRVYMKANILKGNIEQSMACAELAMRCMEFNPEERPSMMEAAKELRRIRRFFREKTKEIHFLENGARLLEEMITSFDGRSQPIRSFSKQELEKATNNYQQDGVLHHYWCYKLYKGTYEGRAISVKKFTESATQKYIGMYINEVAIASQMSNHKNVLKLLGCCLETQVPTLVYEFAASGRLSDHIFEKNLSRSKENQVLLSWESKVRIAMEIADAVAYLHNGTSKTIIHRDINFDTIYLDQHYVAKLFDFGLSVWIPLGQRHVDADLVGTFGYTAPESLSTGRYTEKSDVYNFGVVLFEILTGKRIIDICTNEQDIRVYMKANILKGNTEQSMACAELAMRCMEFNPEERPSMMEAAKELTRIRRFQHDSL
ncbi:hypothetical protein HHK36_022278 [Tetracentron sinense]|uniref:Protein kinase domain-containing protein n=1 Tax=Tetracentron sinense TaxID=13715 RepID=A0A835D5Y6_TETSI|nr:hypothetical protein HHK36_022278 [Tetracentron sinense]